MPDHDHKPQIRTQTLGKIRPALSRKIGYGPEFQRRPQVSAQPSNFLVNLTIIRGLPRKLSRSANLQGESPVSNSSIPASRRFARFVAFVPHSPDLPRM